MNGIHSVVFDTNILFSSVGWLGNPHHCVQAARHYQCLSLTCESILAELAEKLQLKRGLDAEKTAEATNEIRAFSKVITISGTLRAVAADPDDDAVLECAVVGQAEYLVSGDRHLLALGNYQAIRIMKATEFLMLLQNAIESK